MLSSEYTDKCIELAEKATATLQELSNLMKENGEESRSMDVDEAITYIDSSVERD